MQPNMRLGSIRRKPDPLPNLAARALADPLFRQRVVKSKKAYTRKLKHRPSYEKK